MKLDRNGVLSQTPASFASTGRWPKAMRIAAGLFLLLLWHEPAAMPDDHGASFQSPDNLGAEDSTIDPAAFVDPFIGVLDDESNCVIGPQLPFGSINPSPQTPNGSHDGYSPAEQIRGFGQLHASGTGWGKYGQVFVSPQLGLAVGEKDHDSPKSLESARAFEYAVLLTRYNIRTEITPSRHSAIYRFTFPKSDSANVVVDITHNIPMDIATEIGGHVSGGEITIDTSGQCRMRGRGTYSGGFGEGNYDVFFCAKFSAKPRVCGTWRNGSVEPWTTAERIRNRDDRVGGFATFSTFGGQQVIMKVAVSLRSADQAEHWLDREIPAWDYEKLRDEAHDAWNTELRRIEVRGGPDSLKKIFYTALYHTMLMPRNRTSDIKGYPESATLWDDEYAVWDTWRTLFPLMTLINPSMVTGNVNSFIERFKWNRRVKDSFIAGIDMNEEQGGNDVDNIIADACLKGIPGVNWEKAYAIVKHDAEQERKGWEGSPEDSARRGSMNAYRTQGWMPAGIMSCSKTLEYAYNDYCAGLMARHLGKTDDCKRYLRRSARWRALWNRNATSDGFRGFVVPRLPDRSWVDIDPKKDWGSWKEYFYEGSSWTYSYFVPHQFEVLVNLCGGKGQYAARLEHALENRLIDYSNEPAFLALHSFHYAGRSDLASLWIRRLMNAGYSLKGYPGNDDSGAMSSWFVFAAMGFFPNAGQDLYYLHGPIFSRVVIHIQGGKSIVVTGKNASRENIYVQSLRINGRARKRPFMTHTEIRDGAKIEFVMGERPSDWGK